MSRTRRAVLALAVALVAACVVSAPAASAADVVLPFTNYKVGGSLTVKKLNQSITLPDGSTFNGSANLTTAAAVRPRLHPGVHVDDPGARRPDAGHDEARRGPARAGHDHGRLRTHDPHPLDDLGDPEDQEAAARAAQRADHLPHGRADPAHAQLRRAVRVPVERSTGRRPSRTLTGCGLLGPTLGTLLSGPGNAVPRDARPPSRPGG